jgi:hypothetical protein
MGMNDINMTTAEQFVETYNTLLDTVHEILPDAKLFAASITPISCEIDFSNNAKIDSYNAALKTDLLTNEKGYGYVDVAQGLKNAWNGLNMQYSGGDGIHLAPEAYYVYLNEVCQQLVDTGIASGVNKDGVWYGKNAG